MEIKKLTFNSFQENSYIISSNNECMIIDPGCCDDHEREILSNYINENNLIPKYLINTHCHLDHIFGNRFVSEKYNLKAYMHKKDFPLLENAEKIAEYYQVNLDTPSKNVNFIDESNKIILGETEWKIIFTPGHAPGHICLLNEKYKVLISGDVLFYMSIGRTDLPLCNHEDLIKSIKEKLFRLNDEIKVLPGHGQETSIGFEKKNNPFLN